MVNVRIVFFSLLTFLITSPVIAEKTSQNIVKNQPTKIGLVLSGGGARGLAHIGVIKSLEQRNIKIDYIAGTSMGALIGGLYAAGLSSDEIEKFATQLDWEDSFNDLPKRGLLPFRQKQDEYNYFIKGEIGMRDWRLELPSGLVQGQKQDLMLEKMLLNVANIHDFNKLPIPFSAVATDISSGKAYILNKGNLAKSLRASMSVPGFFAPVEIDGRLLVDGGITNNTPINIVRQMGAEMVIVSDLHNERTDKENIHNFLDVSGEIINGLTLNNSLEQLSTTSKKDIVLKPVLALYSSADFDKAKKIIQAGEHAIYEANTIELLAPYRTLDYQPLTKNKTRYVIQKIKINNQTELATDIIRSAITQQIGAKFDSDKLEKDLANLYGYGFFQNISYDFTFDFKEKIKNSDLIENATLVIHATRPNWGPNFFKINFSLKSNLSDQNLFNLGIRHSYKPANSMGGEWRNEIRIGEETDLKTEFYQPLTASMDVFIKPYLALQSKSYIYSSKDLGRTSINFNKSSAEFGVQLGINLNEDYRVSSSFYFEQGAINIGRNKATQQKNNYHYSAVKLSAEHDSLDQVSFPRSGSRIDLSITYEKEDLHSSKPSYKQHAELSAYYSINRHTFNLYTEYSNINQSDDIQGNQFHTLGGFQRLSGYRENELIGTKIAFGRIKYQYRVLGNSSNIFNFPFYLGGTLEAGNVFNDLTNEKPQEIKLDNIEKSASLFIGMNSFLGPLYFAYGYHSNKVQSIYFYFGKSFN